MTELINITPHAFTLCDEHGAIIRTIEPTKPSARVSSTVRVVADVDGIPVTETTFGAVENLPAPAEGVAYIVSLLVKQAAPERDDLYRPDTGPQNVVRDASGNIVGVKALAK